MNRINRKPSLISVILIMYASISMSGFLLINSIYSETIKNGWISDIVSSRQNRTADFAQMIQQEILSGSYPSVVYKALRSLDQSDMVELEIKLSDGYVVFSQSKSNSISDKDLTSAVSDISSTGIEAGKANVIGKVRAVYRLDEVKHHIKMKQELLYWWFSFILLISLILIYLLSKKITTPIKNLSQVASLGSLEELANYKGSSKIFEIFELENRNRDFAKQLLEYQSSMLSKARDAAIGEITAQVVHDIRSPLAALDMMLHNLPQLPEDKRLIIRSAVGRIRDISNNLIGKKPSFLTGDLSGVSAIGVAGNHLLSTLIDNLITEKRTQYRSRLGIEIEYKLDSESYGLFSVLEPVEFGRMLSNLIDNAVESIETTGRITLNVVRNEDLLEIQITDNGRGIPEHRMAGLGQRGNTFGKAGGSGLGLHYAKKVAGSLGGKLKIKSTLGKGTTVSIELIRAKPPEWFVETISVESQSVIVIFDDDPSIHQIWQERFEVAQATSDLDLKIEHFSTPEALRAWVRLNGLDFDHVYYLIDYELLGFNETGLDLIEELHIYETSILVSSHFEEELVKNRCAQLKVPMIPKGMAGFIPIHILRKDA